jgi:hypothetical protein
MSDGENKALPSAPDPPPEPVGSGKPGDHHGVLPPGPVHPPLREPADDVAAVRSSPGRQFSVPPGARADTALDSRAARRHRQKRPKPLVPGPARRKLAALTAEFASGLKADPDLTPALVENPLAFRSELERLVRSQFRLKRGRDPRLDAACRMVKEQGRTVPEVLRLQVKNFENLDAYTRYLAAKGLRQAVARRAGKTRNTPRKKWPRNPAQSETSPNHC